MKNLEYQQKAVTELIDKTIRLLNVSGQRNKLVFEATTGAGKNNNGVSDACRFDGRTSRPW